MSNIIPPLLSNTPPPPPSPDEDDDDEFGDFTGANDISYGCDNLSLPPSPDHSPKEVSNGLDINSNADKIKGTKKDFQDKRKHEESFSDQCSPVEDIDRKKSFFEHTVENNFRSEIPEDKLEIYDKNLQFIDDRNSKNKLDKKDSEVVGNVNNFFQSDQTVFVQRILDKNVENDVNEGNVDFNVKENKNISTDEKNVEYDKQCVNGGTGLTGNSDANVPTRVDVFKGESEKGNFEDIKNLENKRNEVENVSLFPEVESDESNISPKQNSCDNEDQSNCKDNLEVEAEECKTSQEEETVATTFQGSALESEAAVTVDNSHKRQESFADDDFSNFACANDTFSVKMEANGEDFADFEIANVENSVETEGELTNSNDDFGDFSTHNANAETEQRQSVTNPTADNNDFDDDFGEFTCTTIVESSKQDDVQCSSRQDNVEFGNFANFTEVIDEPVVLMLNEKQAFEKAEIILKEIFPVVDEIYEDFRFVDFEKDDFIFNELKDVTETQALTYQWSKSAGQNLLLKALNIDARNILYGPPWNPSMPRFAANLGLKPLEPIKSEILTPSIPKSSPSNQSVLPTNVEIPNAQFDWTGSGLVNPLDSVSKNSAESSSPTDITQRPLELSLEPSFILQPKPVSLQEDSVKAPSKTDLEQKVATPDQQFDDFKDFMSYHPPSESQASNWPSVVPLRETYISNDNITSSSSSSSKEVPLDIENWLQPTIVTPELPRKDLSNEEEELPDIHTPELMRKNAPGDEYDDEFDDFQMVLPDPNSTVHESAEGMLSDVFQTLKSQPSNLKVVGFSDFSLFGEKPNEKMPAQEKLDLKSSAKEVFDEDDDFTDFHSSVPVSRPIAPKALTPILEPLKPVTLYPTVAPTPTQINWPDPGITDEEIKKFEMVFSRPQEAKIEEPKKEGLKKLEEARKPDDDDEWSDFVSVQKPSPVHRFQTNRRERTSSPDLPLSVLNLGSVQPAKAPIPVITPQGIVQTKLSSNHATNMSPKSQLKDIVSSKPAYHQPHSQPSIISNQFATQAYNFNNYLNQNSKAGMGLPSNQQRNPESVNQKSLDDDDWSDFVSSPLPQPTVNGYQQNWNASLQQQAGWTNTSPNIITNPRHFVQSGGDLKSKKVPNVSVNSKKSTIPSIPLPDLEFIAPKGRTSSSRRK